ncbi:MAG: nucleoside triphosphate pyrophosphohydrolase [Rhodothermales bacterium]|nr:nucleoside triphosphate pyrophosphohydrolase [Rhodothermales bacterium]MBO6780540.1 nucleoside triphosphate pyrophosphohydrolase [Rhodothermales bacterium]
MSEKIFDPQFTEAADAVESYADFVAIVRQLRRDCPWDREQTHESVKHLLIEEAYETVDAIDAEDWPELRKELGDLLLHVVFHAVIAEQGGRFTLKEVIETEAEKLIVRHPHVFGDTRVDGVGEVLTNWEQIKMKEKGRKSALDGVPGQLPALLRAHRIQEKAAGVGFDFPEAAGAWDKVEEEIREFGALARSGGSAEALEDELGDVLFALVNYARFTDLNAENALRRTNAKFTGRFQHIEKRLREQGRGLHESDLEEMDRYWDEAKAAGL